MLVVMNANDADASFYRAIVTNDFAAAGSALQNGACANRALGSVSKTKAKEIGAQLGKEGLDQSGFYDAFTAIGQAGNTDMLELFVHHRFQRLAESEARSGILRCLDANLATASENAPHAPELAKFIFKTWHVKHIAFSDSGRPVFNFAGEHMLQVLIKRCKKMNPKAIAELLNLIPPSDNKIENLLGVLNEKSESEMNAPWLLAINAAPRGILPWLIAQYPILACKALKDYLPRLQRTQQRHVLEIYTQALSALYPKPKIPVAALREITKNLLLVNDAKLLSDAHRAGLATSVLDTLEQPQNTALAFYVQQCEAKIAPIQWHKDMIETIFTMAEVDGALNRCGQVLREQITSEHDAILRKALLKHNVPLPKPTVQARVKFAGRYPRAAAIVTLKAVASLVRRGKGRGGQ